MLMHACVYPHKTVNFLTKMGASKPLDSIINMFERVYMNIPGSITWESATLSAYGHGWELSFTYKGET